MSNKGSPAVVGPQPFSFESLLRNIDPAPDEETDRFVEAIYVARGAIYRYVRGSELILPFMTIAEFRTGAILGMVG